MTRSPTRANRTDENALAPGTDRRVVRAAGLHVAFGGAHVLRGIDLSVERGEVVAVLGANGSGKSTLVRTMVRAVAPTRGSIEVLGTPVGPAVPWHHVGYVPQRIAAGAGVTATAQEIVASGLLSGRRLVRPRDWRARTAHALDQVDLADRGRQSVAVMSGGQQQRVLIARALVREPELLILDEPVAGVDRPSQIAFARTLGSLRDRGTTIVVVLHELAELTTLVTRAVVLDHGQIVHDGAPPRPAPGHDAHEHAHVHPHAAGEPPAVLTSVLPDAHGGRP